MTYIIFLKINFIQNLFAVHTMTATASSAKNVEWLAPKAINGILIDGSNNVDMFHSDYENYRWLAIDLGFHYKVSFNSVIFVFCKL